MQKNEALAGKDNLSFLTTPDYKIQGAWFAVEPTPTAWKELEKVQKYVVGQLKQEGIESWVPYPHPISHATIFMGFNDQITNVEKEKVMKRIANKIAAMPKFEVSFDLCLAEITRGPGPHVILKIPSREIKILNQKVREAIAEAIDRGEFDRNHLFKGASGKRDKLEFDLEPHFTLGVIDSASIPPAFTNPRAVKNFEDDFLNQTRFLNGKLRDIKVSFPVESLVLLDINQPNAKVANKVYTAVATCGLDQGSVKTPIVTKPAATGLLAPINPAAAPKVVSLLTPPAPVNETPKLAKVPQLLPFRQKAQEILGTDAVRGFDITKTLLTSTEYIKIGFANQVEAEVMRSLTGPNEIQKRLSHLRTNEISKGNGDLYWIMLDRLQCETLFGKEGSEIYNNAIAALKKSNPITAVPKPQPAAASVQAPAVTKSVLFRIRDKIAAVTESEDRILRIEVEFDERSGKDVVKLGYKDKKDAEAVLAGCGPTAKSGKIFDENGLFWVRLGDLRFQALFEDEGSKIYNEARDLLKQLQTVNAIATPSVASRPAVSPAPAPAPVAPVQKQAPEKIDALRQIADHLNGKMGVRAVTAFRLGEDNNTGKKLIHVVFTTKEEAEQALSLVGVTATSGKVFVDGKYFIVRLGIIRLQHMFGNDEGTRIFNEGVRILEERNK